MATQKVNRLRGVVRELEATKTLEGCDLTELIAELAKRLAPESRDRHISSFSGAYVSETQFIKKPKVVVDKKTMLEVAPVSEWRFYKTQNYWEGVCEKHGVLFVTWGIKDITHPLDF